MKRKIIAAGTILVVFVVGYGWQVYQEKSSKIIHLSAESKRAMLEETQAQREELILKPEPQQREEQLPNDNKNLYFGDLHVHTSLSFDSYLFGNRVGLADAYRFANGQPVKTEAGEVMQISRPLDFVAMTDHSESFGLFVVCGNSDLTPEIQDFCEEFETPSVRSFVKFSGLARARPPVRPLDHCDGDAELCQQYADATWRQVQATADEFYQPGKFTTFSAYEYSPMLKSNGKMHRNVIFKSSKVPKHAVSAFDALSVLDLWRALERDCQDDCDFLTIPHNMNRAWGIAYSGKTIDGDPYNKEDWLLRGRNEPLAEIFQIKGASECGVNAGAVDEECGFEQMVPICEEGEEVGCGGVNSYAREGLKKGLELGAELGVNPLQFGFIGSTDTHNGSPGDTEEWDYRGVNGVYHSPARQRLGYEGEGRFKKLNKAALSNPGGLAAVWARENTRESIFEALRNKETYGTSGSRIQLRFFAAWDWQDDIFYSPTMTEDAYNNGVAMGSVLAADPTAQAGPEFLVWAVKDPIGAKLQRVQMVKAWIEEGKRKEQVVDIACSDGLFPDATTGRCPSNGAQVNMSNCSVDDSKGANELKVVWRDPDFNADQSAFYYVRVLQNPTCRWSTYDAIRLDVPPRDDLPALIRERAWSSPIWYTPS